MQPLPSHVVPSPRLSPPRPCAAASTPGRPVTAAAVIPTHLRPDRLRRALDAVLAQDCRVTVVVVDDADDPATREVVARCDERVTYVVNPGRGASSSRNLGARSTCADVVAFLDDDDVWDPAYLSTALSRLDRDGSDVVFTQIAAEPALPSRLDVRTCVAVNPGVTGSNIVIRREAFERTGGFDELLWVSNDKDFLVRVLDLHLPYSTVAEPLVSYTHHDADRLTAPSPDRVAGLRSYYLRYADRMSPGQRLHLRGVILSTSARTSAGSRRLAQRALALACFAATPAASRRRLSGRRLHRTTTRVGAPA